MFRRRTSLDWGGKLWNTELLPMNRKQMFLESCSVFAIILAFILSLQEEKQRKHLNKLWVLSFFLLVEITICANQISVKNECWWLTLDLADLAITSPIVMKSILKCHYYRNMRIMIVKKIKSSNYWIKIILWLPCYYLPSNNSSMWSKKFYIIEVCRKR